MSFNWKPIQDLPPDRDKLRSAEIASLANVWRDQRQSIEDQGLLQEFKERLTREWSIETGIIERIYTLDRGITRVLIEKGIDASLIPHDGTDRNPALVAAIIRDHHEVAEGLFTFVKGERQLTTSYVKELHAALTRHQASTSAVDDRGTLVEVPLLRGAYKLQPNNPHRQNGTVHEYCPPMQVAAEMDRLVALHIEHQTSDIPPEVESAWLHHAFTQIHPFQDGNGRVARCLASLVFLKAGWFPLVIRRDDRERYIVALEQADDGDLSDLVHLFVRQAKKSLVGALGVTRDVLRGAKVSQIIDSVHDTFVRQQEALRKEWGKATGLAIILQTLCHKRLEQATKELKRKLGELNPRFQFRTVNEPPDGNRGHYFRYQIIEAARSLDYFADLRTFRAWTSLQLQTDARAEILYSFHGVGQEFRGVIAASAIFFRRNETAKGEQDITDVAPLSDEIFQVNYRDVEHDVKARFERWLDETLARGLEVWKRGL